MSKQNYNIHKLEHVLYEINCEGCGLSTGAWYFEVTAIKEAQKHGFVAYHTPEDGVLNFCPKCDVEPENQEKD